MDSRSKQELDQCPSTTHTPLKAFSLATTLMAVIVIFRAGDGTLSVMPASEYDGDSVAIVDEIDPFAHDRQKITARDAETLLVSAPADGDVLLWFRSRRGGGGGATFRPFCLGDTTMFIFGIILSIAAIGFFCWLLFTLAVFALPFFAGVTAGGWAYHTGAGWLGAILIGTVAAGPALGFGRVLLCNRPSALGQVCDRRDLRRARRHRGLSRRPQDRETHHPFGDLADRLLGPRLDCGGHHGVSAHCGHGSARPCEPGAGAGLGGPDTVGGNPPNSGDRRHPLSPEIAWVLSRSDGSEPRPKARTLEELRSAAHTNGGKTRTWVTGLFCGGRAREGAQPACPARCNDAGEPPVLFSCRSRDVAVRLLHLSR